MKISTCCTIIFDKFCYNRNMKLNFKKRYSFKTDIYKPFFIIVATIIGFSSVLLYFDASNYLEKSFFPVFLVMGANIFLFIFSFAIMKSLEEESNQSVKKTDVINMAFHQLRSPIVNLSWIVDALENENDKEKTKKHIKNLKENIKRVSELIEDFFVISEIENNQFLIKKEIIDLKDIIEETVSRFNSIIEYLGLKIILDIKEKDYNLFINRQEIKLVIENLIDNAINYGKIGEKIKISLKKNEKEIYFEIEDKGMGIPEKNKEDIFKKFFRAENAKEEKEKGSGLGLFIAKSIIEKEEGKIWFNSKEGEGTTFFFSLPIKNK